MVASSSVRSTDAVITTLSLERGHDKERQLEAQLLQKKLEEEKASKFKAIPHPYTTDCPEGVEEAQNKCQLRTSA
ncbi:protein TPX2-like [Lolium rigidum]|uniref:protein TPX2-like n=1 Tax=Lolium rigidum TaxID=89674 RepID=UPI001F5E0317|nr:protein TPX2-like [Lolium rigidum]